MKSKIESVDKKKTQVKKTNDHLLLKRILAIVVIIWGVLTIGKNLLYTLDFLLMGASGEEWAQLMGAHFWTIFCSIAVYKVYPTALGKQK